MKNLKSLNRPVLNDWILKSFILSKMVIQLNFTKKYILSEGFDSLSIHVKKNEYLTSKKDGEKIEINF